MKAISRAMSAVLLAAVMPSMAGADSDEAELKALKQAVHSLQQRVEVLEALRPTMTSLMPNLAERFHVMHRAGEAGDWAVAGHELQEMRRLATVSEYIDAEKGELMQGMLAPSFEGLEHAIEDGNLKKFQGALEEAVTTCNACHNVTGSPFVQVSLDVGDSISMRHPHALTKSVMVGRHTHGAPAIMQEHMDGAAGAASDEDHYDGAGGDENHDDDKHQD